MNNIATSLVESYMYSDMYNREGGESGSPEKIQVGGAPVNYMVSSLNNADDDQKGGKLKNKVVPAGLVVIQIRRDPDVEFEEQCQPDINRNVVPHELFDKLFESVLQPNSPSVKYDKPRKTPRKSGSNKKRSRKST